MHEKEKTQCYLLPRQKMVTQHVADKLQITQLLKNEEWEKTKKARSILQCVKLQSGICSEKPFMWLLSHFHFTFHRLGFELWDYSRNDGHSFKLGKKLDLWLLPASLKLYEEIPGLPWENHAGFFWRSGGLVDRVLWKDYWKLWEHGKHLLIVIWTLDSAVFQSAHLLKSASNIYVTIIKIDKFNLTWKEFLYRRGCATTPIAVQILDKCQVNSGFYQILQREIQENGKILHEKIWFKNSLCKIW